MKETMDSIAARADDCMGRGDWDGAERVFLAALAEAEETGDRRAALSLCSELMGFYRQRGDAGKFYPVFDRGMELLGDVRPGAAARGTILINAATALAAFGEAQRALPLFRESESLYAAALDADHPRLAALYNNMAAALDALRRPDEAERYMLRALENQKQRPGDLDLAVTYVNLAQHYAAQNDTDARIAACLDKAMERMDSPDAVWEYYYAHTARKIAPALEALGRADAARDRGGGNLPRAAAASRRRTLRRRIGLPRIRRRALPRPRLRCGVHALSRAGGRRNARLPALHAL